MKLIRTLTILGALSLSATATASSTTEPAVRTVAFYAGMENVLRAQVASFAMFSDSLEESAKIMCRMLVEGYFRELTCMTKANNVVAVYRSLERVLNAARNAFSSGNSDTESYWLSIFRDGLTELGTLNQEWVSEYFVSEPAVHTVAI